GGVERGVGRAVAGGERHARPPRDATEHLTIVGARANNLRNVTVKIPLGMVVAVTGASGSGKSTLVDDILYRAIARARGYRDVEAPCPHTRIQGSAGILEETLVEQAPLRLTARGHPATYTVARVP